MIWLALLCVFQGTPAPRIQIDFTPDDAAFAAAAREYGEIWRDDGVKMVDALESVSGLRFDDTSIRAIVLEAPSSSGFREIPMRLRASYPPATKGATMMHELGHRLQGRFFRFPDEDHPYLFLFLYDAWVRAFGQTCADEQVVVESARKGIVDYETMWKGAAKWHEFLRARTGRIGADGLHSESMAIFRMRWASRA